MNQIVEFGFPTLRTTDIITHIGGIELKANATVTVTDLAANSGGLFWLQGDANGDLVLSTSKLLDTKLEITDSQNVVHVAEPFQAILIAGTRELVGTRPPVHR